MGFKPQKVLKIYYKVKPASFIYPDEKVSCYYLLPFFSCLDILKSSFHYYLSVQHDNGQCKQLFNKIADWGHG